MQHLVVVGVALRCLAAGAVQKTVVQANHHTLSWQSLDLHSKECCYRFPKGADAATNNDTTGRAAQGSRPQLFSAVQADSTALSLVLNRITSVGDVGVGALPLVVAAILSRAAPVSFAAYRTKPASLCNTHHSAAILLTMPDVCTTYARHCRLHAFMYATLHLITVTSSSGKQWSSTVHTCC
jgi:hypothetical protein